MIALWNYLKPSNLPPTTLPRDVLQKRREIILQALLDTLLSIYALGFGLILIILPQVFRSGKPGMYLIPFAGLAFITLFRRINYYVRALTVILTLQALGVFALLAYGLAGTGIIFLVGATILSYILFRRRVAAVFAFLSLAIIMLVGYLMASGALPLPKISVGDSSGSLGQWIIAAAVTMFVVTLASGSLSIIIRGMDSALHEQENLSKQLADEQVSLERRVEERSADLKNRVAQFEIASQIAREISGETNLESLLDTAVNLIRDRFGFYHAGIFVNDPQNEYAILRAATGEAGRAMLERNHRLKIGEIGLVGYAARRGEARMALDVRGDLIHYQNPLLPDTRSEIALPLKVGDRSIGALDVQSVIENAFNQDDVRILQIIADQIAIAFEKTRLVDELSHSLHDLETTLRSSTREAWRSHMRSTRHPLAYHYHNNHLDNQVEESPVSREAMARGELIVQTSEMDGPGRPQTVLAVPIKQHNHVLGIVDIRFNSANVSPELISLIENTVDRLAVSLENARLLEEIQSRAERERLVGEISTKVRAASDVDTVMRIAIQEIGRSLGVSEVMVQLRKDA